MARRLTGTSRPASHICLVLVAEMRRAGLAGFFPAPNGLSQSNVGVKVVEPIAPGGWSFIAQGELAFDPYSLLLANAPQAMQNGIGVRGKSATRHRSNSSRWGWLNTNQYVGVSNPRAGTLTFGRQNALETDGIIAYDPMGGSYAFSPIGYSGKTAGAGDTEDARWTTAIKYRVNIGDGRFSAMLQPIGLFNPGIGGGYGAYNPNNGAVSVGIGGDIKHSVPGVISWDLIGTYERDAVNIGTTFSAKPRSMAGQPRSRLAPRAASRRRSPTTWPAWRSSNGASASYGGGPGADRGVKGPLRRPTSGIPLTLYAGYEWIQFSNPSDPQTGPSRMTASCSINRQRGRHGALLRLMARRSTTTLSTLLAERAPVARTRFSRSCGPVPNTASPEIWMSSVPIITTSRTPYRERRCNCSAVGSASQLAVRRLV